jgi:DNA-binding transcriptional regulator WhiA
LLAAILAGEGRSTESGDLELRSRSAALARLALLLLKEAQVGSSWRCTTVRALGRSNLYAILIPAPPADWDSLPDLKARCCRRSWLAGWFAASGSVCPAQLGYHMEWTARSQKHAEALEECLRVEGLGSQRLVRRGLQVVSLRRAEEVAQALSMVGATAARLRFEEVRALKETRNHLRRQVNAETANLERTTRAALRQLACLRLLESRGRLEGLPVGLAEVARLRLRHQDLSLREIGERLNPPLTRATVGRKLAHLERMAAALGDPMPGQ